MNSTYPVNPVFSVAVCFTPVECIWGKDEQEVFRLPNALQQIVVKLASFQSFNVYEHCKSSELQMDFEQTCQLRTVRSSVANEYIQIFLHVFFAFAW